MSSIEKVISLRKFGLLITALFTFMAIWSFFRSNFLIVYFIMPAVFLFIVSIIKPGFLAPIHKAWMTFGKVVSGVNSTIILTIIYFMAIVPTKFLKKLLGKDSRQFSFKYEKESYWIPLKSRNPSESMKRLF